jgi:hypothetical protein
MNLIGLSVLLSLLSVSAYGQMIRTRRATPLSVPEAIQALQNAPEYQKASARADLVDAIQAVIASQGSQVLDPIVSAVRDRYTTQDPLYIVNCILTLGEVKSRESTALLISVLSDTNTQYAYQAATALGEIWEGTPASAPEVKQVSPALLALLYSDLPPTVDYAPAIALIKINSLAVAEPTRLSSDELLSQVDKWVMSGPAALPATDQLPWQVLARLAVVGPDAVKRTAIQALRQKRDLGAVEPILVQLAAGTAGASAADFSQLLGELTGVPYPPAALPAGATSQETADAWRALWLDALKTKADARSVQYSWNVLENTLRFYAVGPQEGTAKKISEFYRVLLYQLSGPGAVPAGASAEAKSLLTAPLLVKEQMAQALTTMEGTPTDYEENIAISKIDQLLGEPSGTLVAQQFLARLIALARKEASPLRAQALGNILWRAAAAVPLDLNGVTLPERQQQLDKWVNDVRKTKPELGL